MDMTLKELCEEFGITRRMVQGYEREGMLQPTGKNKYGYLLYDSEAQERVAIIKRFRDLDYSLKETKNLIDAPKEVVCKSLKLQVKQLECRYDSLKETISAAKEWIASLEQGGF